MKRINLLFAAFFLLLSCNNEKLEKEIVEMKKQNDILKKHTPDSLSIYKFLKENKEQQYAEKFVDSLRRNNPKLYEKIEREFLYLMWNSDSDSEQIVFPK